MKAKERQEARRLRAEGMRVRRIAAQLGVALSSVSVWVRDIELPAGEPRPQRRPGRPMGPLLEAVEDAGSDTARHCSRCERILPLAAFNRSGDGHQHWCRGCFREYFRARGERHLEQVRSAKERRIAVARAHIRALLCETPCLDCGEDEPLVLEFDHRSPGKTKHVSLMVAEGASVKAIDRELALCDVVCACCHRRRTALRAGWFRVTRQPRPWWTPGQRRNHELILERLERTPCIECGEPDPVVLEFDHRGDKRADVTKLANSCSAATLEAEMAKCDVRCVNCHRARTMSAIHTWLDPADWVDDDAPGRTRTSISNA